MRTVLLPFHRQGIMDRDISITKREKEMLDWLREGKTSWEISIILGISENTVNFHIKNIIKKFDVANRTHLISIALQKGLVGTKIK